MDKIILKGEFNMRVRKFNLLGQRTEFEIKPIPNGENPVQWIRDAIEQVVIKSTEKLLPTDKVGITLCGDSFIRGAAWVNFKNAADLKFEDF